MTENYPLWAIREMAEAHKLEHPTCTAAMDYILGRCDVLLDDGK